jgi:two-component system, NarL family, response regulator YdfI
MIRIAIAAESDVVRAGIAALVSGLEGIDAVGQPADAEELARLARSAAPDVVLIDPGSGESDALAHFLSALSDSPRVRGVVIFGDDLPDPTPISRAHLDAWAFLPRRADASEIDAAIRAVAAGLIVTHPLLAERGAVLPGVRASHDGSVLTPREIGVLGMLAAGLPNKAIAKRLGVSAHTVKFHVGSIMTKLHASSRTEAVTDGIRRGLIFL